MARSTSTRTTRNATRTNRKAAAARTTRPTRVDDASRSETRRATDRRTLKYFNFQYNRDDVSHARGANSVTITDRSSVGNTVSLSLQEARALYDFIGSQIRSR